VLHPLIFLVRCVALTLAVVRGLCSKQSIMLLSLSKYQMLDTRGDKHSCVMSV
jgi:hypothetical protein